MRGKSTFVETCCFRYGFATPMRGKSLTCRKASPSNPAVYDRLQMTAISIIESMARSPGHVLGWPVKSETSLAFRP